MADFEATSGQGSTSASGTVSTTTTAAASNEVELYKALTSLGEDNSILRARVKGLQGKVQLLEDAVASVRAQIDSLNKQTLPGVKDQINNVLTKNFEVLAIFVALFTFVSIQFQVFSHSDRQQIVPISLITVGCLLGFVSLLSLITSPKSQDEKWRNVVRLLFLAIGLAALMTGYSSYRSYLSDQKDSLCVTLANDVRRAAEKDVTELSNKYTLLCK